MLVSSELLVLLQPPTCLCFLNCCSFATILLIHGFVLPVFITGYTVGAAL